jgi:hypothetical protein
MSPQVMDAEEESTESRAAGTAPPALKDVAVVLGVYLAGGLACGVLWWLLVDPATFTKLRSGATMDEGQLARRFDADGWYTVLGAVVGLVTGAVLTWWRSRDFLLTTVLVSLGSGVAAAVSAWLGHVLGPPDPRAALAAAHVGARVPVALEVHGWAVYLVWPAATLVGTLVILWSPPPEIGTD